MSSSHISTKGRTLQACEPCRSLKVRCLPSSEGPICQKCQKSGASCIFVDQKPRVRIAKPTSKARISALESKLNELIAQVDQSSTPAKDLHTNSTCPPPTNTEFSTSPNSSGPDANFDIYHGFPRLQGGHSLPELLSMQCALSLQNAEEYLTRFRAMSSYFPFVIVPEDSTVLSMSRERPYLLLAILTVSSLPRKSLQRQLEKVFRQCILQKVMLDGDRSMDLLTGILVYLAWYHFFYIPKREQSYQFQNLAISMCVDLGLNLRPSEAMARKVGLRLDHYQRRAKDDGDDEFFSKEARRAFLGCYYIASMTKWLTGKPNHLEFSDYMAQCGASLAHEMEYPTDEILLPLIQLHHLAEESHVNLQIAGSNTQTQMSVARIQAHLSSFRGQLQNWKSSLSPLLRHSVFMNMCSYHATIYVDEMGLLNPFTRVKSKGAVEPASDAATVSFSSPIRVEILLDGLEAAKHFFEDCFLQIPTSDYCNFSYAEWDRLIYATVMLYKLSVGSVNVPEWDAQVARSTAPLDVYLETLCERIHSVSQPDPTELDKPDLFALMGLIFDNVKQTYGRLTLLPQSLSATDSGPVHSTSFSTSVSSTSAHNLSQHRCPAFPFWGKQASRLVPEAGDGLQTGKSPRPTGLDDCYDSSDHIDVDPFADLNFTTDNEFWAGTFSTTPAMSADWSFGNI